MADRVEYALQVRPVCQDNSLAAHGLVAGQLITRNCCRLYHHPKRYLPIVITSTYRRNQIVRTPYARLNRTLHHHNYTIQLHNHSQRSPALYTGQNNSPRPNAGDGVSAAADGEVPGAGRRAGTDDRGYDGPWVRRAAMADEWLASE